MRDYALIWNKRTERYDVFDLRDSKRQRDKLGEFPADFMPIENIIDRILTASPVDPHDRSTEPLVDMYETPGDPDTRKPRQ